MHKCDEYIAKMNMYLDGELPVNQISALLQHIEGCESCRRYFDELKAIAFETRNLHITPPESLHQSIMAYVRANTPKKKKRWPIGALAIAACAALLIGFSGILNQLYVFSPKGENLASGAGESTSPQAYGAAPMAPMPPATGGGGQDESGKRIQPDAVSPFAIQGALDGSEAEIEMAAKTLGNAMPDGYAFYYVYLGDISAIPNQFASESKVAYAGFTMIYLPNDADAWTLYQTALEEQGFVPIEGLLAEIIPQADSSADEGLLFIVAR